MLDVEEALQRVLSPFSPLEAETVPVLEALGRVLAEDVSAKGDIPPHANSSMDGYAVRARDTAGAGEANPVRLQVLADLPAGYVADQALNPGTAIRIMTGAPIPPGADGVVKVEDTVSGEDWVGVRTAIAPGNYVRPAGEDVRAGDVVLLRGTGIRPQEIGMMAALGKANVAVTRRPRVAILATGDELVPIDAALGPGKIRDANSYSNAAQVVRSGGEPLLLGIASDDEGILRRRIHEGLAEGIDLLLTSGGVSVGDFDLVKRVLAAEGTVEFWRVRMKPGRPLAFGRIGRVPVLGLPGNPVSAMVSFEVFVRPAIRRMLGASQVQRPRVEATLMNAIPRKDDRRHFARVRLEWEDGSYRAYLTGGQGSGILSSMVRADGLAVIPEDWASAEAGAKVDVIFISGSSGGGNHPGSW